MVEVAPSRWRSPFAHLGQPFAPIGQSREAEEASDGELSLPFALQKAVRSTRRRTQAQNGRRKTLQKMGMGIAAKEQRWDRASPKHYLRTHQHIRQLAAKIGCNSTSSSVAPTARKDRRSSGRRQRGLRLKARSLRARGDSGSVKVPELLTIPRAAQRAGLGVRQLRRAVKLAS